MSHTMVGRLVTAAVNEHWAQFICAYNQTTGFRGCQPLGLSPYAASSASHCFPEKKSCWCGRSRPSRSRSGVLSSGRPPSCCRSARHKGRWQPRRGPSCIPNVRAFGDQCYHIKKLRLWSSDQENGFLPLVSVTLPFF